MSGIANSNVSGSERLRAISQIKDRNMSIDIFFLNYFSLFKYVFQYPG